MFEFFLLISLKKHHLIKTNCGFIIKLQHGRQKVKITIKVWLH